MSKLVPLTVTDTAPTPLAGVKLVMVGTAGTVTVNADELVAEPFGLVTPIVPVVAPDGTVTTSIVVDADEIEADVPLNVTVFEPGVALNPVPWIVTVCPIGPSFGENSMIET